MKVQAVSNNYRAPSFGVKISVPAYGSDREIIKEAIANCPYKEDLNRYLNDLNNAKKYNWRSDMGLHVDNHISLGIDTLKDFPKDFREPFVVLDHDLFMSHNIVSGVKANGMDEISTLYAINNTNDVKLYVYFPRNGTDKEKAQIMYKFLTSLCNIDTTANKYFWQDLKFNKLNQPNEPLSTSPEKHNIFTDINR